MKVTVGPLSILQRFSLMLKMTPLLLALQLPAFSAVTVVNRSGVLQRFDASGTSDGSVSRSLNDFEVTGGDLLLVIASVVFRTDNVADGNTSVTYGTTSLNRLMDVRSADGESVTSIFYLESPTVGVENMTISFDVDPTSVVPVDTSFLTHDILTLSNVDLSNPFGSMGTNAGLSTGISLDSVEAGNLVLYGIGASGGLGNPPANINGATAADYAGFVELTRSIRPGTVALNVGAIAQETGTLTIDHPQAGRDGNAVAIEINAVPEPASLALLTLGSVGILLRRGRTEPRG